MRDDVPALWRPKTKAVEAKHGAWVTSWTTRLDPDLWRPEATPEKRIEKVDGSVKDSGVQVWQAEREQDIHLYLTYTDIDIDIDTIDYRHL